MSPTRLAHPNGPFGMQRTQSLVDSPQRPRDKTVSLLFQRLQEDPAQLRIVPKELRVLVDRLMDGLRDAIWLVDLCAIRSGNRDNIQLATSIDLKRCARLEG